MPFTTSSAIKARARKGGLAYARNARLKGFPNLIKGSIARLKSLDSDTLKQSGHTCCPVCKRDW